MTAPLPTHLNDPLILYGESFGSRLLLGTSRYPSPQVLETAVQRARPAMMDAALQVLHGENQTLAKRFDLQIQQASLSGSLV